MTRLFKKKGGKRYFHPRSVVRDIALVSCLISIIFFNTFNWWYYSIGISVFLIVALLHLWCKACLVRNEVVTTWGPYNIVRHPFYLANLLIDSGLCIASGNMYLLIGYFILFPIAYLPEIIAEEGKLTIAHGEQYQRYRNIVPGLLPYKFWRIFKGSPKCPYKSWDILRREHELPRLLRILSLPLLFPLVRWEQTQFFNIAILAIFIFLNIISRLWMRRLKAPQPQQLS